MIGFIGSDFLFDSLNKQRGLGGGGGFEASNGPFQVSSPSAEINPDDMKARINTSIRIYSTLYGQTNSRRIMGQWEKPQPWGRKIPPAPAPAPYSPTRAALRRERKADYPCPKTAIWFYCEGYNVLLVIFIFVGIVEVLTISLLRNWESDRLGVERSTVGQ